MALLTSVTKNWQTLLEFARTLPPEGEVSTTATPATTDDGATTATTTTIATPPPQSLRQHHTRLTPAQKDEVITLYQQGVPVREICQRYDISRQQVSDLRNARGILRRPRGLSDEQKRQAEQHYLAGQSCAAIGRQFGVHAETVRRYLHTTGITLRPRRSTA
ncbi:helix-turn-helix domain-containing protein [Actinomyces naeslundii]